MQGRPSYRRVFQTFARNSLIREMTFRVNFLVQCISATSWTLMNIGFYIIVFKHTDSIGKDTGWQQDEFFLFLGTTWLINSLVQTFFMPNVQDFSELIRTGNLDFVLVKPIDTQFLISFQRMEWSSLSNFVLGLVLLIVSLVHLSTRTDPVPWKLEPVMFAVTHCTGCRSGCFGGEIKARSFSGIAVVVANGGFRSLVSFHVSSSRLAREVGKYFGGNG